jgi:hypothetical protein
LKNVSYVEEKKSDAHLRAPVKVWTLFPEVELDATTASEAESAAEAAAVASAPAVTVTVVAARTR